MGLFKSVKSFLKRKLPATFNAAEFETERILKRLEQNEVILYQLLKGLEDEKMLFKLVDRIDEKIDGLAERLEDEETILNRLDRFEESINWIMERLYDEEAKRFEQIGKSIDRLSNRIKDEDGVIKGTRDSIDKLNEVVMRADLNAIVSCKSDDDYDKRLIPLNRYFNNRGMAVSMHLTSVADKPIPIVYETADIIRTSALSLMADEIHRKQLDGAVAEFGVARGKFARVLNALFPEKTLHLFDTFEGFPEYDVAIDAENNFSDAQKNNSYDNIDMNELKNNMPHLDKCLFHKGYFPQTAEGVEEEFCFVSIDCDLYKPICEGLNYFYPRLVKGGCIFVHDYRSKYFTGVKVAVTEFAERYGISYCVLPDNTGTAVILK